MDPATTYECFCGDAFSSREELVEHNMGAHNMAREVSERKVMEKYPRQ